MATERIRNRSTDNNYSRWLDECNYRLEHTGTCTL